MDEIQRTLVKVGRKDLAQEYYKKTSMKKNAQISDDDIKRISREYDKLLDSFFDSLIYQIEKTLENIKKAHGNKKVKDKKIFDNYLKDRTTTNLYGVYNGIFGPNEINSKEMEYTFKVESQKEKLEKLDDEFHKLTE